MFKSMMIIFALAGFNTPTFGKTSDTINFDIFSESFPKHDEGGEPELTCDNLVETLQKYERPVSNLITDFASHLNRYNNLSEACGSSCTMATNSKALRNNRRYEKGLRKFSTTRRKQMDAFILMLERCLSE